MDFYGRHAEWRALHSSRLSAEAPPWDSDSGKSEMPGSVQETVAKERHAKLRDERTSYGGPGVGLRCDICVR